MWADDFRLGRTTDSSTGSLTALVPGTWYRYAVLCFAVLSASFLGPSAVIENRAFGQSQFICLVVWQLGAIQKSAVCLSRALGVRGPASPTSRHAKKRPPPGMSTVVPTRTHERVAGGGAIVAANNLSAAKTLSKLVLFSACHTTNTHTSQSQRNKVNKTTSTMSDDEHDYAIETADAGASATIPMEAGQIKKGGYVYLFIWWMPRYIFCHGPTGGLVEFNASREPMSPCKPKTSHRICRNNWHSFIFVPLHIPNCHHG